MKPIKYVMISVILMLIVRNLTGQYTITFSIPSFPNDTLLFGHYFSESLMLKDTFFTDNNGFAKIQGEKNLPGGMYTVYLPNAKRFDLLLDSDQQFSIVTDTSDIVGQTNFKGSRDNKVFYGYLAFLNKKREQSLTLKKEFSGAKNEKDSLEIRDKLMKINEEVKDFVESEIDKNQEFFVSVFLKSMKEIEVPDPPRDENGVITDSSFQRKYYKDHYFQHFDISDVRMLRTPLYEKRLKNYLNNMIYPHPDSIYREVDWLIAQSRTDSLLFKYMLTTLFNHYASSKYVGLDAVYAYIAEKYYIPEATWSDKEFIKKLKERVSKLDPLLIGKVAPDIQLVRVSDGHFQAASADTSLKRNPYVGDFFNLHTINADYTLLYFWESDCGHCKKSIPQLHDFWNRMQEQDIRVEIVAVNMLGGIEGKVKWINFINEHQLYGWVNAWNPYDFSYKETYDVTSSNILYLLDSEKKIISKRISAEQAEKIIEHERNL